jgi:two-component system sensor histidine kinase CpxA
MRSFFPLKSLFTRMLLWCGVTVIVCLAGSVFTGQFRHFPVGHRDFFSKFLSVQLENARSAYENGGEEGLRNFFNRYEQHFPGNYGLVNKSGIDVLTGIDREAEVRRFPPTRQWRVGRDRMKMSWPSQDGKYTLIVDAVIPPGPPNPIPYYLWIVFATIVFCYILAVQIGSPLLALEHTVDRFGRGDLDIRAKPSGGEEFGKLARAFNLMADRLQTLLTAERRLLQDVSHELRSPLARLKFATELARTSGDRERSLDRIEREIDRLTSLVSELLQVTRAENDPQTRNLHLISLSDLVTQVVDDCSLETQALGCRVQFSSEQDIQILGDRELLRRAFENVLRNAIRYAPEDTRIKVTLEKQGGDARIEVRDYGPGVPDSALENLFKPFFRVDADRNKNSGGVGLGLSIAERAVAVHGGRIRARNAAPGLAVEILVPTEVSDASRAKREPVTANVRYRDS